MTKPIDIPATYRSEARAIPCVLRIVDAGIALLAKKQQSTFPWDIVRRVSFDDPGRTKANVGAIAVFGVLGMASRRAFTVITVSTDEQAMYFENETAIGQWKASAFRIVEAIPASAGRVWVDGAQVASSHTEPLNSQTSFSAGWYPDPLGQPRLRWYDGMGWTDHIAPTPAHPE
jgi:hypothetical protein